MVGLIGNMLWALTRRTPTGARSLATAVRVPCPSEKEPDTNENEVVSPNFFNRNPHNLERMALAVKDRGWTTQWPSRLYWHRLRYQKSQHHITAFVEHYNGTVVVQASTKEWAIKKHLYNTRDVMASENVGRVLAQRCLEAGISYVTFRVVTWQFRSESIQRFHKAMKDGGVVLSEPKQILR
ncbi:39S ribosomal protein L18, mitochondrial [Protopterus annectens]|uniref:39S ribosomal protein L18, mitochondrial n=1 Tax=Protopterus annectens TaxID=7888 RepID=UPI001CFAC00A|nr:39S ribosomal protein L18, mitochondrial [Protopterus annectens]